MKIAFFTDVLVPPVGGIEQYILDAGHALAERGHEVKVFAPDPLALKSPASNVKNQISEFKKGFEIANLEFRFINGWPARALLPNLRLAFPLYLYSELKEWGPEVIHFHTIGPVGDAAVVLAKLLKPVLLVGTFHSYLMEPEYLKRFNLPRGLTKPVSQVLWNLSRLIYDQADLAITPSAWVAGDLKKHHFTKPIKVVHNGVDLKEFAIRAGQNVVNDLINKYQLGGKTLLYVGRLSEEKGLDVLLKAVSILNLKLLLVGDGPAKEQLEKLAKDLGIYPRVIFLGRIDHENLGRSGVYEASQIFVNPSTSETFSLVTIEAMAKGLPIVVAQAKALTELVKKNGFLFAQNDESDLADKIGLLIGNEVERSKMSEISRQISLDYSLEKVAENLEKAYLEASSL